MNNDEQLTKVYIDLPEGEGFRGESFWAKALGNDLYELRNSSWHAPNLNFLDVVRAIPDAPDEKPRILEVVQPGGYRTIIVFFSEKLPPKKRLALLEQLNTFRAFYEGATDKLFALRIEPEGNYQAVCNRLLAWALDGILNYELRDTTPRTPPTIN